MAAWPTPVPMGVGQTGTAGTGTRGWGAGRGAGLEWQGEWCEGTAPPFTCLQAAAMALLTPGVKAPDGTGPRREEDAWGGGLKREGLGAIMVVLEGRALPWETWTACLMACWTSRVGAAAAREESVPPEGCTSPPC